MFLLYVQSTPNLASAIQIHYLNPIQHAITQRNTFNAAFNPSPFNQSFNPPPLKRRRIDTQMFTCPTNVSWLQPRSSKRSRARLLGQSQDPEPPLKRRRINMTNVAGSTASPTQSSTCPSNALKSTSTSKSKPIKAPTSTHALNPITHKTPSSYPFTSATLTTRKIQQRQPQQQKQQQRHNAKQRRHVPIHNAPSQRNKPYSQVNVWNSEAQLAFNTPLPDDLPTTNNTTHTAISFTPSSTTHVNIKPPGHHPFPSHHVPHQTRPSIIPSTQHSKHPFYASYNSNDASVSANDNRPVVRPSSIVLSDNGDNDGATSVDLTSLFPQWMQQRLRKPNTPSAAPPPPKTISTRYIAKVLSTATTSASVPTTFAIGTAPTPNTSNALGTRLTRLSLASAPPLSKMTGIVSSSIFKHSVPIHSYTHDSDPHSFNAQDRAIHAQLHRMSLASSSKKAFATASSRVVNNVAPVHSKSHPLSCNAPCGGPRGATGVRTNAPSLPPLTSSNNNSATTSTVPIIASTTVTTSLPLISNAQITGIASNHSTQSPPPLTAAHVPVITNVQLITLDPMDLMQHQMSRANIQNTNGVPEKIDGILQEPRWHGDQ
eukprot:844690_1